MGDRGVNRRQLLEAAGLCASGLVVPSVAPSVASPAVAPRATAGSRAERSVQAGAGGARVLPQVAQRQPLAGPWVELDRSALAANLVAVRKKAGGSPVMAVIKANAYGHGVVPVARALDAAGADAFMVISVDEALAVRGAGLTRPILNFGPYDREGAAELIRGQVDQVVYTRQAIRELADLADELGVRARVQLMVDTGLGRTGAPHDRVAAILEELAAAAPLSVAGTLTALTEDPEFDREQLRRFEEVCASAAAAGVDPGSRHVAASAAVLDYPESHLDMVRPGITLYGHYPNERTRQQPPIDLSPVLALRSRVAYVKQMRPGDSIGYHRAYRLREAQTVATLPVGHSEGYPPAAVAAGGWVGIRGARCPLIGEVTSNHLEVAVPPGVTVEIGDVATLIDRTADDDGQDAGPSRARGSTASESGSWQRGEPPGPSAHRVATWAGVSVYGLLMRLNPLMVRVIR